MDKASQCCYVTYPYARIAGATINDMNKTLEGVDGKKKRKAYDQIQGKRIKKAIQRSSV